MTISRRNRCLAFIAVALAAAALAVSSAPDWRARRWDTLELCLLDNPTTLDPALIKDVTGGRLAALLYPNLVMYSEDETLAPDAAESWEASSDARCYTFRLRPGASFADGSPLEAADVAASFERALSPEVASPRAWVLAGIMGAADFRAGRTAAIDGIECLDDHTVRITLERPSGTFLSLLTMPAAAILPRQTPRKPFWGTEVLPTAGGPYRVRHLEPDIALTLEANPHYYGRAPRVAAIRYRVIRNPFAMVAEFRQGRLDLIDVPDAFDRFFSADPSWQPFLESVAGQNTFYLGMNCTRAPFDDRGFRRAVSKAIDRESLIEGVLRGRAAAAAGPIPPGLSGHDPELSGISFDLGEARRELARPEGVRTLSLLVLSSADSITVAQALAGQLSAAGLRVEVESRERGTFKALLAKGDFDMVYYSWVADYADGENFLVPLFATSEDRSGGNYTAYSSADVDALLAEAAGTAGEAYRVALYRRAARIVVEDAPRVFLWHSRRVTLRQPWIKGLRLQHVYNAQRYLDVEIDAGGP